jgi:transposase
MAYSTLITGPERRRRWSETEKAALVAAAFSPGAKVAEVARQADVCTSLLYRWRRGGDGGSPGFAPAVLVSEETSLGPATEPALIVELGHGRRVVIARSAPAALVAAALRALR